MITQSRLKELLTYNKKTGIFRWRKPRSGVLRTNRVAGTTNERKYILIGIDGKAYNAHRLAWLYVYGKWPRGKDIDHKNCDKKDNRILNLRLATRTQTNSNRGACCLSSSGIKGVQFYPGRKKPWYANITRRGEKRFLGYFKTKEEAGAAYAVASKRLDGEFFYLHLPKMEGDTVQR